MRIIFFDLPLSIILPHSKKITMQHQVSITYCHPDTEEEYTITATILRATKAPFDAFARFQEPEDEDEIEITRIVDADGINHPDSDFSREVVQDMRDQCYIEYAAF